MCFTSQNLYLKPLTGTSMSCIRNDATTPILLRGHNIKLSAKSLSYTIHEKYTSEPLSEKILLQ